MAYKYVFNPLSGAFDTVQDVAGFVPYTGATTGVNLGSQSFQTTGNVGFGTAPTAIQVEVKAPNSVFTNPDGPIVFSDSFIQSPSALLSAHAPNVGTSWTLGSSTGGATYTVTTATACKPTATLANVGCLYLANFATPAVNMEVSVRIVVVGTIANTIGLVFRYVDSNNFYLLTISNTAGNTILYKKVAGAWTTLGQITTITSGANNQTWKTRILGSQIAIYRDAQIVLLVTDTSITAAGIAGLSAGTIGQNATDDVSTTWQLDDYAVTTYTSVGTTEIGANINGSIQAANQFVGNSAANYLRPAYSFAGDLDTGVYRSADNVIGFATAGVERFTVGSSITATSPFRTTLGTAGAPGYAFVTFPSNGMYCPAGNQLAWSISSAERMNLNSQGQLKLGGIFGGGGSISCPFSVYTEGGDAGGFATQNNTDGGYVWLYAPTGQEGGVLTTYGNLRLQSGWYSAAVTGANLDLLVGTYNSEADAGNFTLSFNTPLTSNGGNVTISAGNTSGSGANGGQVSISAGRNTGTSVYSKMSLQPFGGPLAVFGATGSPQVTTSGASATVGGSGGTSVTTASTFDGYTLAQVVKALRDFGWLA